MVTWLVPRKWRIGTGTYLCSVVFSTWTITPNSVHVFSTAGPRHALTQRSKGQTWRFTVVFCCLFLQQIWFDLIEFVMVLAQVTHTITLLRIRRFQPAPCLFLASFHLAQHLFQVLDAGPVVSSGEVLVLGWHGRTGHRWRMSDVTRPNVQWPGQNILTILQKGNQNGEILNQSINQSINQFLVTNSYHKDHAANPRVGLSPDHLLHYYILL